MRNSRLLLITLLLSFAPVFSPGHLSGNPPAAQPAPSADLGFALARLPLSFEPNEGQTDGQVRFLARGQGYTLFLTADEAVLALQKPGQLATPASAATAQRLVVRLKLLGANPRVKLTGEEELPGKSNYFLGNDPGRWHTDLPTYAKVRYAGLYPGVDALYYGREEKLEYDFIVAPGVDPRQVRLRVEGAERVRSNRAGELVLETPAGEVVLRRPEAYQGEGASKRRVAVRYAMRGKAEFGFEVLGYSKGQPLVIDPVLDYSTYLGGSGGDIAYAIGLDSLGNTYVAGFTNSTNFPTANAYQKSTGGNGDAFVSKFNVGATVLVYSTYLGGSGADSVAGLAVASTDDVFLTGSTTSPNFPVVPVSTPTSPPQAFQTVYGGNGDAFVTELASTGNKLVYSSYLGGSGADFGQAIAVDSSGNAYVTGSTQSADFPTLNAFQPAIGGSSDAFVTKVNIAGTALVYSTFLGGAQADTGQGIQVDSSGNAYIDGYTFSTNFPTMNPIQSSNAGDADAFVSELNPAGSALVFSTYLGGSGRDRAWGLALDSSANIYVVGDTQSSNFPTTSNAFQLALAGTANAFVSKLSPSGASLAYSTFLGGSGVDQGNGITVDSTGNMAVVGSTNSSDFPTVNPLQSVLNGTTGGGNCGSSPCSDAFITELKPSGNQAVYSTFLGGSDADFGEAIAVDSSGNLYVAGSTLSSNFPVLAGAYQGDLGGVAGNAFVAEIEPANSPAIAVVPGKLNFGNETESVTSSALTVTVINGGSAPLQITAITPPSSDFTETDNCVGTVAASGGSCLINVQFTPTAVGSVTDQFDITDNASGSPQSFTVTGTGVLAATAVTVAPTSLTFANTTVGSIAPAQTVTITNSGTSTLDISGITITGDYSQTNTCAALVYVLNVGQSCSVSVTFAPTVTGTRSGSLSIADNASGSPQVVALTGQGVAVFALASKNPTVTAILGVSSATFTIYATASGTFTGAITPSCPSTLTCTFNPTTIFANGASTTLTVDDLSATTTNPLNFAVSGTSGSQVVTLDLTLLLQTYTFTVSPPLQTILPGYSAKYTLIITPLYGFNQQITLLCSNLPPGGICTFSNSTPTPNGSSPASVGLTVSTTSGAPSSTLRLWPGGTQPPRLMPVVSTVWLLLTLLLFIKGRRLAGRRMTASARLVASRACVLAVLLSFLVLLGSCRGITPTYPTPTGSYVITVTGELSSNTTVQVTTTVDLAVT